MYLSLVWSDLVRLDLPGLCDGAVGRADFVTDVGCWVLRVRLVKQCANNDGWAVGECVVDDGIRVIARGSRGSRAAMVVFLFCSCASHSYFWGSSMLWLCPSVFPASRMAELHAGVQACSSGMEVDCVRRQALAVKGCTAQARSESGRRGETALTFGGSQVVSRSDMAAWLPVQRAWTVGLRAGGAGWANMHCPKRLKPAQESKPNLFSRT